MKVTFFCLLRAVAVAVMMFFALFSSAAATGIVGLCSDCHTMHNSEQGQAVAKIDIGGSATSNTPITNLLRMDCIACHAQNAGSKIVTLPGGSQVPQVYHYDTSDLAAGNFRHITDGGNRKGHNVADLFPGGDIDYVFDLPPGLSEPPGMYKSTQHIHYVFTDGTNHFARFTCAGSAGCHGTRSQVVTLRDDDIPEVRRRGLTAISGAHHKSRDGAKNPTQDLDNVYHKHDGARVADGYRFIQFLKGYGNEVDRWQNVSAESHNEYYGDAVSEVGRNCASCHALGTESNYYGSNNAGWYVNDDSTLFVPNQSMSGFCSTCHSYFHGQQSRAYGKSLTISPSGAFLRHPSDYVIPDRGEYSAYTEYNITAPVARPAVYASPSATVTPGTDMVMCLSCHMAHASPYDGMLRFDYQAMVAGQSEHNDGCMACHTSKGILPEGRGN